MEKGFAELINNQYMAHPRPLSGGEGAISIGLWVVISLIEASLVKLIQVCPIRDFGNL